MVALASIIAAGSLIQIAVMQEEVVSLSFSAAHKLDATAGAMAISLKLRPRHPKVVLDV